MSKYEYTRDVEINLSLRGDGNLYVNFCDAQVAQWTHGMGPISEFADEAELAWYLRGEIESIIDELAESLAKDLYERVLKK